jgi:long-chain acyl-CoA synthetase
MADTLRELLDESLDRHADRTAIRVLRQAVDQKGDQGLAYVPMTYRQLREQRDRLAVGLANLGLEKGSRVAVLTDGGLEPLLVFLACDVLGLSSVPLCNKLPDDTLVHNLDLAGPGLMFCDPGGWEQVQRILPRLSTPMPCVLTEGSDPGARTFFDLIKKAGEIPQVPIAPDDEAKVLFTSGSSGMPKGVSQSHRNIVDNVRSVWDIISRKEPLVFFKSAPDYHTMGVLNIYYPLAKGWSLDLARSPDRVLVDIRHSEPQAFLTVPLILDKVYGNVRKAIAAGGARGKLVAKAVGAKQRLARGTASVGDRLVNATVGGKIVRQIKERLSARVGSRLELLIVGSAKADPEALDFFQEVLGITSYEGYGVTECAPLIAANSLRGQKTGTVGQPLQEVKLMAEDGRRLGYGDPFSGRYESSHGVAGELWVSGTHVMKGYLGAPEQTAEVLVPDGEGKAWYRTGDLFSIDGDGYLTFHGRLGRQFKLRNGEFVNPELLERLYAGVPLVEHVLVTGDQTRDFPLPLVTVSVEEARTLPIPDLPQSDDAVRRHPGVGEQIRSALLAAATQAGLPRHERPQRVVVLPEALSEATGTLTRGMKKMMAKAVVERYRALIDEAYGR